MHELSIALSIVDSATEEIERHPGSVVSAVHLRVGALSGVVKEALLFSWEIACQDSSIEGARLIIEDGPATILCARCQKETETHSIQAFSCSTCGQFSSEVIGGRELEVVALELEDVAETAAV
jgi:hydrogenase nickel incorporation protein HypA/HybF